MSLIFSENEYNDRLNKVKAAMDMASMDALLLTKPESMYYLSGYLSPPVYRYQSMILPRNGDPVLILAEIEKKLAQETTWFRDIIGFTDLENPLDITRDMLKSLKVNKAKIGIEKNDISGYLPVTVYEKLINLLPEAALCDASDIVGEVRLIKSDSELEYMRKATQICQEGMKAGINSLTVSEFQSRSTFLIKK
jgi:Xaa-Pro dipeptidase